MKTDYEEAIDCADSTVKVGNDSELEAYLADYGFDGDNYQNLKIIQDINRPSIAIHSPCTITVKRDLELVAAERICLDGRGGVVTKSGVVLDSQDVNLLSQEGSVKLGKGVVVNTERLVLKSFLSTRIGANAEIDVGGHARIQSTGSFSGSKAIIKSGASLDTESIHISSLRRTVIGPDTSLSAAGNIHMYAPQENKCSIDASAVIVAGSESGNCLVEPTPFIFPVSGNFGPTSFINSWPSGIRWETVPADNPNAVETTALKFTVYFPHNPVVDPNPTESFEAGMNYTTPFPWNPLDLTGATRITFWAKGESGGESVRFGMGGLHLGGGTPDRDSVDTQFFILTKNWQQFTIDLRGVDLSKMNGGFRWVGRFDVPFEGYAGPVGSIYVGDILYRN
jgi:hypothetical protein